METIKDGIKNGTVLKIGAIFLDEKKNTLVPYCSIFYIFNTEFNTEKFNHLKDNEEYKYLFKHPMQHAIEQVENRKDHPQGTNIDAPKFLCWIKFKDTIVPDNIKLNYPIKNIHDNKVDVSDLCDCNNTEIKIDKFLL